MAAQKRNYSIEVGPGIQNECEYFTCGHCQVQLAIEPSKNAQVIVRLAAPCGGCQKYLCQPCMDEMSHTGKCVPWEKRMEQMERKERFRDTLTGRFVS